MLRLALIPEFRGKMSTSPANTRQQSYKLLDTIGTKTSNLAGLSYPWRLPYPVSVGPRTQPYGPDQRLFVCQSERTGNVAGHRHGSTSPSQTPTPCTCDGAINPAVDLATPRSLDTRVMSGGSQENRAAGPSTDHSFPFLPQSGSAMLRPAPAIQMQQV
jgi:hypothetical protein